MLRVVLVFSVLLAGFLGFVAQPILAKFTLPILGGGGGVWTLVSIAFQGGLLLGYCYALFLLRLARTTQLIIHSFLGIVSFVVVCFFTGVFSSEIAPWAIFSGVGLAYFFLSSTTPLVQGWVGGRMTVLEMGPVYRLFSYSNIAAIGGLFSYPFLIEPEIGWSTQIKFWSLFYFLYLGTILFIAYRISNQREETNQSRQGSSKIFYWLILPGISTSYLLSISFAFSQNIPPSPLIWTVPLSLYLLSYAIAFAGWVGPITKTVLFFLLALGVSGLFMGGIATGELTWSKFPFHCAVFFAGCLLLHGMLFDSRPNGDGLPKFYAAMAGGGFLGGVFSLLLIPQLFSAGDEIWLFHLISGILPVTGLVALFFRHLKNWGELVSGVSFASLVFLIFVAEKDDGGGGMNKRVRNFHGAFQVKDSIGWTIQRDLIHGGTAHGSQSMVVGEGGMTTTYYTRNSGIGAAAEWVRQKAASNAMLCVGVGTGTVASWAGMGDKMHFVDIDRDMIDIARQDFSYIQDAVTRGAEVLFTHGDGRGALGAVPDQSVDFFILDAFNGGGIPTHLLTAEAFLEYTRVLKPDGVVVVHVSSRELRLSGVATGGLASVGLVSAVLKSDGGPIGSPSIWVVGARNSNEIREIANLHRGEVSDSRDDVLWSDDFSSIYKLFK